VSTVETEKELSSSELGQLTLLSCLFSISNKFLKNKYFLILNKKRTIFLILFSFFIFINL
jgi:hypothetical protein